MKGNENIRRFLHIRRKLNTMATIYTGTDLQQLVTFQELLDELTEISSKMAPEDWTEVSSLSYEFGSKIPAIEDYYTNSEY